MTRAQWRRRLHERSARWVLFYRHGFRPWRRHFLIRTETELVLIAAMGVLLPCVASAICDWRTKRWEALHGDENL